MNALPDRGAKPMGRKAYGSIPHLIGSRRGPKDWGVNEGQHRICTEKVRDRHDWIVVQEKLDGSCCAVANVDGEIVALGRAGFLASTSPYEQHHVFHDWVEANRPRFEAILSPGERVVGEWLALAHGTRYDLKHDPFVAFDIMRGADRVTAEEARTRCAPYLPVPHVIAAGNAPVSIEAALAALGTHGHHGATDPVEGAMWRVERQGKVDFLAKFVVEGKVDGAYLAEIAGCEPIWNWRPEPRA